MESATISLLESGLKDTESFFDSLVKSFKRMLAEMAYQAAIKPIVVQTVASLMPGGSSGAMGLDFHQDPVWVVDQHHLWREQFQLPEQLQQPLDSLGQPLRWQPRASLQVL